MGLRRKITDDAYFDASLFSNIVSNRIVTKTVPIDKEKYYLAVNDETRSYFNDSLNITALSGLQTTFRARNLIPEIALNLNLTYTWQAGFEDISGKGTIRFVREVPSHSFQAGLSFKPYRKLYINLDFVAFSSWYKRYFEDTDINDAKSLARAKINGFSTLDMTTRWQFAKSISGFVKILNVFDARYGGINATGFDIDLRYTPQPGRNIHLGISINMN
jgi:hemoglobin/transferrin/lactoferrin receptor protein